MTALSKLPQYKATEVADFAVYILKKYDESLLQTGIEKLISDSKTYEFLKDEEDLYIVEDLKVKYK